MKQKKIILYVVIFTVVAVIAYALISTINNSYRTSVSPTDAAAKEISCDITVSNPIGIPFIKNGDLAITSVNCQQQFVANCARFGIFSDTGALRLEGAGGLGSAADVKVSENSMQSYTLSWCGSKLTTDFNIKIYNDNGGQLQNKAVKLV